MRQVTSDKRQAITGRKRLTGLCAFYPLACILLVLLFFPTALQAQSGPTLVGQVTNGTSGGELPVGAPINLQFFSESAWTQIYTTTLSADGTFRFEALSEEVGHDYVTRVVYRDIAYFSEPARLAAGDVISNEVIIFEPTEDPSSVHVDQVHFFIVPMADRVRIAEYYLVGNTGNRAFVGALDPIFQTTTTLAFSLPAGAENLTFDGPGLGERYVGGVVYFADTRAILPGSATLEISFSYDLAFQEGMSLNRTLAVPVESVVLVANSESLGLSGTGLTFNGILDTQMGPAASYTAGPLSAGESLTFALVTQTETARASSTPAPVAVAPQPRNATQELGIGVVALALGGLLSYWLWQSRSPQPMPEALRPLVEEIIALDAQFAGGALLEADYRQKRESMKQHLKSRIMPDRDTSERSHG